MARLLVRSLIPAAMPGSTMEDVVTAKADYSQLDRAKRRASAAEQHGRERENIFGRFRAQKRCKSLTCAAASCKASGGKNCVLACYNVMIPYLCPDLPDAAKRGAVVSCEGAVGVHACGDQQLDFIFEARHTPDRFARLLSHVHDAGFSSEPGQIPVSQRSRRSLPCCSCCARHASLGLPVRDQNRAGRVELLQTPYSKFERNIRDQLGRMLGGAGFDPARDIAGITVNRWAHGYAFTPFGLDDPTGRKGRQPWVIGRQPFGKITIANSDAGASAYTDVAIDQAWRALARSCRLDGAAACGAQASGEMSVKFSTKCDIVCA